MNSIDQKIGVLLVNLGTPDSPRTADVRKYLIEFLTDERVIDIPWLFRQLLVRGLIGPFRAGSSAKSYKEIWDDEKGSPLMYHSEGLAKKVQITLDEKNKDTAKTYCVELAMRYQSPSIEGALNRLRDKGVNHYIVLPLFPQYASATTGSIHQKVMEIVKQWQSIPSMHFIDSYYDNTDFIAAFTEIGQQYQPENYEHILFSFHGLPKRQLRKADRCNHCLQTDDCCAQITAKNQFCYSAQCTATAHALAKSLQIPTDKYSICYQSRLGNDPWVEPYTSDVLENLAKEKGIKKVLVFCPAFVADCIETIFEIGVEYQEEFEYFGGEKVQFVESLNEHPLWVQAVVNLIEEKVIV
jgi:ferrochelatase